MLVPIIFTSIAYPMVGLRPTFANFGIALAIVALVANVATSFGAYAPIFYCFRHFFHNNNSNVWTNRFSGYFISCASSSISMALSIAPPLIIPFLLFGGFFLNSGSVPIYFKWLSYLSWFRYGNEALLINQWSEVGPGEIECNRLNATCPADGRVVLQTLNFDVVRFILISHFVPIVHDLLQFCRFIAYNLFYF